MKNIMLSLLLIGAVLPVRAETVTDLNDRVYSLAAKFDAMQAPPNTRIPADYLRRAQGIILLDRTRAGVVFAYEGGAGVAMAKDPHTQQWSPPAFLKASQASLGFQIGAEQNFYVILLMTTNATRYLTEPTFDLTAAAQGTAGNTSSGVSSTIAMVDRPVLVYTSKAGLYGGAAIKAGAVSPDDDANRIYYGQFLTMEDILFGHKVPPTPAGSYLAAKIQAFANPASPKS